MRKEQTQKADALLNERVECKSAAALGSEALVSRSMKSPFGKEVPMTMHKMYELLQGVAQVVVVVGGLSVRELTAALLLMKYRLANRSSRLRTPLHAASGPSRGVRAAGHTTWTDKI